ncbi:hypothetical protein [Streptomyces cinereoruber]|uniref:hypothetical protein n=1 Tax=Streptomyces cinereoruber TaxID=67260 RepID=UPI0036433351
MGRAEDHLRAEARREAAKRREEEREAEEQRLEVIPLIHAEVPRALARLEEAGWPGAQLGKTKGFLGFFQRDLAFWSITVGTAYIIDSHVDQHVTLGSDGTLGRDPHTMSHDHLLGLLGGLERLGRGYPRRR